MLTLAEPPTSRFRVLGIRLQGIVVGVCPAAEGHPPGQEAQKGFPFDPGLESSLQPFE